MSPSGDDRLRVRIYPAEVLRRKAAPVGASDLGDRLDDLARQMFATMHADGGVGLAAPQVGESIRLMVIDPMEERGPVGTTSLTGRRGPVGTETSPERPGPGAVLVNPVIVDASGREVMEEGCLSVPGVKAKVRRREKVTVEYRTLTGERTGIEAEGLLARILQHELDHLDGMLFIDRLGPAGRLAVRKLLRELEEAARPGQ